MNEAELNALLDRLLALPVETEWVEFKEAKRNFDSDDLGKYFSALSNEANLHRQRCAWLVFGVKDAPRQVVGSQFRNNPVSLQSLKQEISPHLSPNLTFVGVYVLQRPEGRVLLFQIPPAPAGIPVSWKGHMYGRNGESMAGLSIEKIERIRRQSLREDWSAAPIAGALIGDLDAEALALGRQKYREKHEGNAPLLIDETTWDDAKFLDKLKLRINGQLTRAALLLFGKDEAAAKLPVLPKVSWILKDEQGMDVDYQHFGLPLLKLPDALFARVRNLTVRYMPPGTLFPTEVPQYDNWVIREALHNCLAHQDYAMGGLVRVVEKPGELIFSNLGNFLPGSVEEVIAQDVPPEEYRNQCLANAMVEMKLIDTIGSGIRRMFMLQRNRFFPLPDYLIDRERSRIEAHIAGRLIDERYTFALIRHADLTLHEVILLDRVQKRLAITADEVKLLRGKGLIEGRSPNFFVAAVVAAAVGDAAQYTRNKGLDKAFYKGLVISHLRSFESTTREQLEKLLLPKLPEVLSEEQKKNMVKNLLSEMRREKAIVPTGRGPGAGWSLSSTISN